jgi:argininosuccinate lyase
MEESSGTGFATATELADSLVRRTGMPFRTAHSIVGRIAAAGRRPGLADLDAVAMELAGFWVSERGFSAGDLENALDPKSNVALRANTGGPAPSEGLRMVRERLRLIAERSEEVAKRRDKINRALADLGAMR